MGKKKRTKKIIKTEPEYYTEDERRNKISKIMLQLVTLNMEHVLSEEVTQAIHKFIKTGDDYTTNIDLPTYSRILEISLSNNKQKKTYINLVFKKIRVDDENNPINELNKLQETMFNDMEQ